MPAREQAEIGHARPVSRSQLGEKCRAITAASERPVEQNANAMSTISVTEYEHFISFSSENPEGERIIVQYRHDQVWRDEDGVWQVKDGQQPIHVSRSPARQVRGAVLSPEILAALDGNIGRQLR